jgi:hypothetical protein
MIKYILLLISVLNSISASAQNIMITDQNNPNEPTIIMDPKHPEVILAATNLHQYYISQDTGRTWVTKALHSSYGVWGDPAMFVDTNGYFYYFHLSNPPNGHWIDRIVCQKTMNRGEDWHDGTYTGLNGDKEQDKQWSVIDRNTNAIYVTWTQFDEYGSASPEDSSNILFSKSTDEGMTWSDPVQINHVSGDCIDSDNTVEGAVPAVGPNGELYVAWAGPEGVVFNKSYDSGETWLDSEIHVDPMPTGWDYHVPGIYRSNGLPVTVCDLSNSEHRGTIYINWSDQRNGVDDTDVWLSKSTNEGQTWSLPVRVNDDPPGKHQFFTWMAIDQTTGYLYFVFYDRRNHDGAFTDVYMAVSKDGGETFINRLISESPFLPDDGIFFGDYTNITAHNGIIRPIWTRLHDGQLTTWTHITTQDDLISSTYQPPMQNIVFENYPNPSTDDIYISYSLHQTSQINLTIMDANGNVIRKIINDEQKGYGKYIEKIEHSRLNLPPGIYFLQLMVDGKVKTVKQVVVSGE